MQNHYRFLIMVQPILKTQFYKGLWECKFQRKKLYHITEKMTAKLVQIYVIVAFDVLESTNMVKLRIL
jgi:transposase